MTFSDVVRRLKARPLAAAGFGLVAAIIVASAIWGFPPPPIDNLLLVWRPPLRHPILPPIERLPETAVEPDRDVEAAQWNSPYCLAWEDGCTECRRETVGSETRCQPQRKPGATTCNRHEIICSDAGDERRLHQICSTYFQSRVLITESGIIAQEAAPFHTIWEFDWLRNKWGDRAISERELRAPERLALAMENTFLPVTIETQTNSLPNDRNNTSSSYNAIRMSRFKGNLSINFEPGGGNLHRDNVTIGTICVTTFETQQ
jgi:hypothetical protein